MSARPFSPQSGKPIYGGRNKKTYRQATETAAAIRNYMQRNGQPPTYRELAPLLGLRSVATVSARMARAEFYGLLRHSSGQARGGIPATPQGVCAACEQPLPPAGAH